MADVNTIRSATGSRAAAIDEGLRTHMNKVYATMSIGMLITFAAAWAISGLAVTTDPAAAVGQIGADKYLTALGSALYMSPLKWVVMFAPLAFVFGLGAALAGLAGLMAAPISTVEIGMGENVLILAFVVIVIGGIGSIRGAFVSALLIGLIDTVGRAFLPDVIGRFFDDEFADAAAPALASMSIYLLMAVILAFRPEGLFSARSG